MMQQAAELLDQSLAGLPANSLLLVLSAQGDTALCRAMKVPVSNQAITGHCSE